MHRVLVLEFVAGALRHAGFRRGWSEGRGAGEFLVEVNPLTSAEKVRFLTGTQRVMMPSCDML